MCELHALGGLSTLTSTRCSAGSQLPLLVGGILSPGKFAITRPRFFPRFFAIF